MSTPKEQTPLKKIALLSGAAVIFVGAYVLFTGKKKDDLKTDQPSSIESVKTDAVKTDGDKKDSLNKEDIKTKLPDPNPIKKEDEVKENKSSSSKEAEDKKDQNQKKIAAIFPDKTQITLEEVQDTISQLPDETLAKASQAQLYNMALRDLISNKLIYNEAIKAGIDKEADILKRQAQNREVVLQKLVLMKEVAKLLTDDELRKKYDEFIAVAPKDEEIELSHIYVKKEEDGNRILKELQNATVNDKRFEELVLKYSEDMQTKVKKGYIGWLPKSQLSQQEIANASPNTLIRQLIKTQDGYSIFYVKGRRPAVPPTFEQAKNTLKNLRAVQEQYAVLAVDKLRRSFGLELIGLDGKPMDIPVLPADIFKISLDNKKPPKMPEPKDFPNIDEKTLDDNMVVAKLKSGQTIKLKEVYENLEGLSPEMRSQPFHKIFTPILLKVADSKILLEVASRDQLEKTDEYKKELEILNKSIIQNSFLQKQISGKITPQALKDLYNEILPMLKNDDMEVNIRHILVKTKEEALSLIKQIKSGGGVKKFNEFVKTKSIDDSTKDNNGDIGYLPKSKLNAEMASLLFKTPKATMLPEPIQLGDAWFSIIRVEDKRRAEPPTMEKLAPDLSKVLARKEIVKVVKSLIEQSQVEVFDIKGNKIPLDKFLK